MNCPLLFYCLAIICLWSQSGSFLFGEYDDVKVTATDTSGNAGVRKSTSCLKMVKTGGGSRTADLEVPDYGWGPDNPKWSGDGVTGADGSLTATFSGSDSTTATAYSIYPQRSGSVDIELVELEQQQIQIAANVAWIQGVVTKINQWLDHYKENKIFSLQGSLTGTRENTDFYNNGEKIGFKYNLNSSITGSLPAFSANSPEYRPFLAFPLFYVQAEIEVSALAGSISVSCTYNDSQPNPWVAMQGNMSFETSSTVTGTIGAGDPDIVALALEGSGTASIKAIGEPKKGENGSILFEYEIQGKALTITISAKIQILSSNEIKYKVFSKELGPFTPLPKQQVELFKK